jgi:glutamyl-tRNA synthetase
MAPIPVIGRLAPSPTGGLHVGHARTFLHAWLEARKTGGRVLLRIEDIDASRTRPDAILGAIEDLRWLGLDWDEGPDVGGPHGPYRQSERLSRYAGTAAALLARGQAYRCFCTADELAAEREAAMAAGRPPKYSGRCRALDPAQAAARVAAGEPAALRFRVPEGREVRFTDRVRGEVVFHTDVVGDPVIVRSDGRPAYNFAVVVDDAEMAVTDVVRGEDHISNTPRQILLYEAIGATPPVFAHLSLVLGPDHAPLSKRHGATSVIEFRERGYLPEALVNYLALLGWSPGGGEELVPVREMARRFDLSAVSHSAAVFDEGKLAWMNRHYMKEADAGRLAQAALRYFEAAGYVVQDTQAARALIESLLPMAVGSVDRLDQIPDRVRCVFDWEVAAAAALVAAEPDGERAVRAFLAALDVAEPLTRETFRGAATRARQETGLKGRALFHPLRVALTAANEGPELDLAVPAIDRAAQLGPSDGIRSVPDCAARARLVLEHLALRTCALCPEAGPR